MTLDDLQRLPVFQDQTVIVVKAPEETKLEIPAPQEVDKLTFLQTQQPRNLS